MFLSGRPGLGYGEAPVMTFSKVDSYADCESLNVSYNE